MQLNWTYLSPQLKERGYCVFALTYGLDPRIAVLNGPGGVIPIQQSAQELNAFVERVRSATGASKVDLVGHSEGTYMPQWWLKFGGGAGKVARYVAWTPLYDGTTVHGIDRVRDLAARFGFDQPVINAVASLCGSCPQFVKGSPEQRKLASGGDGAPGVTYTTVMTKYDELVIPYTSGYMNARGASNHVLQDVCPRDLSEHNAVAVDPAAAQLAFNALDPPDARPIDCNRVPPWTGRQASASWRPRGVGLSSRVRRHRVRRLMLSRVPAGSRVSLTACRTPRRHVRRCVFRGKRYRVEFARSRMSLLRPFRRKRLRTGTVIRVRVARTGARTKAFRVTVRRNGRGRQRG
jgi:triacylglycerol lipase